MKIIASLKRMLEAAKLTDSYWVEKAKLDFSIALDARRRAADMSYKDVAEKMGTSQPYITKVFRGDANFTIETMVKLARATGGRLDLQIVDAHAPAQIWVIDPVKRAIKHQSVGATETKVINIDFAAANGHNWFTEPLAA